MGLFHSPKEWGRCSWFTKEIARANTRFRVNCQDGAVKQDCDRDSVGALGSEEIAKNQGVSQGSIEAQNLGPFWVQIAPNTPENRGTRRRTELSDLTT